MPTNKQVRLISTGVKSGAYNAQPNDFIPVDSTAASRVVTLPTAPNDGAKVGVKMIAVSGSFLTTINTGGSDVINKAAGGTSFTLTLLNQAVIFQYESSSSIWYVISDDLSLGQLDLRYSTPAALATLQTQVTKIQSTINVFNYNSFI